MIQLGEVDFTNLMTDFYTVFAPQKLSTINVLIEKYKDSPSNQRNAIQTAYIIYFQPNNQNYNNFKNILPDVGTEKNIIKLMESYSRGERIISIDNHKKYIDNQEELMQKKIEDKKMEEQKFGEEKIKKIEEIEEGIRKESVELKKQFEFLQKELEKTKSDPTETIIKSIFEEMNYEIISFLEPDGQDVNGKTKYVNYDYSNLILPEKKYISTFCIGQRLMLQDKNGSIVGVEVSNIYDDYISDENTPTRILELKKV